MGMPTSMNFIPKRKFITNPTSHLQFRLTEKTPAWLLPLSTSALESKKQYVIIKFVILKN